MMNDNRFSCILIFFACLITPVFLFVLVVFILSYFDLPPYTEDAPCETLPSIQEAEKIFSEQKVVVTELETRGSGNSVFFELKTERCPGKAELYIYYGAESDARMIREKIGRDFFGVPSNV